MSWGPATVFVHVRKNHDGSSAAARPLAQIADDDSYNDDRAETLLAGFDVAIS